MNQIKMNESCVDLSEKPQHANCRRKRRRAPYLSPLDKRADDDEETQSTMFAATRSAFSFAARARIVPVRRCVNTNKRSTKMTFAKKSENSRQ